MFFSVLSIKHIKSLLLLLSVLIGIFILLPYNTTYAQTTPYTAAQVATHNTQTSCWSIVDTSVYDLTAWIPKHPGGQSRIIAMCGIDGTSSFRGYHGTGVKASNALAGYKIGVLGTTPPADTTPPAISGVNATPSITSTSINWNTNESSDSQIEYGLTTSYGSQTTVDSSMVTNHTLALSTLNENTFYNFRVKSKDAAGNVGTSGNFTFTTQNVADTTAPTTPASLTSSVVSSSQINLTWNASTDATGVTGYQVERCSGANCTNFTQIAVVSVLNYADTTLVQNSSYRYRIRAVDAASNPSSYSTIVTATTLMQTVVDTTAPTAPTNLTSSVVSSSQINLTWNASTDATGVTGYQVMRCSGTSCTNYVQIAVVSGTSYSSISLTASTIYRYRVRARDAGGNNSAYSNIVTVATPSNAPPADTTPPTAPTNLSSSAVTSSAITVTWNPATDTTGVTGYQVERCQGAGCNNFAVVVEVPELLYTHSSLSPNTPFSFRVRARDAAGNNSSYSNIVTTATPDIVVADTTPPIVSITNPANNAAVSGQSVDIVASATDAGGLAGVQFYLDGIAISSLDSTAPYSTVLDTTGETNGSHVISARAVDNAGNSTYSPDVNVSVSNTTTIPSPTTGVYTAATVASHNSASNCWSIIDGKVYDFTDWISRHPGGSNSIKMLCGIDGSSLYHGKHGNDVSPANALKPYKLGTLTGDTVTDPKADTTVPSTPKNLQGTLISNNQIRLMWDISTDNTDLSGYEVFSCAGTNCTSFKKIATVSKAIYIDTDLTANINYGYRVRASDSSGNMSQYSNVLRLATKIVDTPVVPNDANSPVVTAATNPFTIFAIALAKDMKSPLVQLLQLLLLLDGVYPGGEVTGYYGIQTELAVKRYQTKYGIITSGTPQTTGYGMVGPKTREKLNEYIRQILQTKTTTTKPSSVTATPPISVIAVGKNVITTERLNVRASASSNAALLGMKEINSTGVITDGPVSSEGYTWWKVTYSTGGLSGWSVQNWLTTSSAADVKTPAQTTTTIPKQNLPTPPTLPAPVASKYTKATVALHASDASCWSIVDNIVYNLTGWISKHPGGADTIRMMCGIDGSSLFHGQHGNDTSPTNALKPYKLGTLGS